MEENVLPTFIFMLRSEDAGIHYEAVRESCELDGMVDMLFSFAMLMWFQMDIYYFCYLSLWLLHEQLEFLVSFIMTTPIDSFLRAFKLSLAIPVLSCRLG